MQGLYTHGGEICRVGEEDSPLITDELVEVNLTLCGESLEVRGNRAQTEANVNVRTYSTVARALKSH